MEKLYTGIGLISKAFLKMGDGRMHTLHPNPLCLPLAISCRNHQKSQAYFSHFALLVLFFLLKSRFKRGGGGHGTMTPAP